MNASECCKTIGCNCAGTNLAEGMQNLNWQSAIVIVVLIVVMLSLIKFLSFKE